MSRFFCLFVIALLAQNALCQVFGNVGCGCNAGIGHHYPGNLNGPCAGPVGYGDVIVAGELPVGGNTAVGGNVPVVGYVMFEGTVPAGGIVSVANNCGCNGPVLY